MSTTPSPLGQPNPLLEQIRQQARQSIQNNPPQPQMMPPPGVNDQAQAPSISDVPMKSMGNVTPPTESAGINSPRGTLTGEQNERNRLVSSPAGANQVYGKITNSGFGQNHPLAGKLLGGLAQGAASIGDTLASALPGLAPQLIPLAQAIPGTTMHHNALVRQEDRNINQMQGEQQKTAQTGLENAQTENQQSEVPLHQAQISAAELTPATADEAKAFGVPEGTQLNAASRAALAKQAGINTSKEGIASEGNQSKLSIAQLNDASREAVAAGKPQPHIITEQNGVPHVMERDPATKAYSIDRGIAPPNYASMLPEILPTHTEKRLGPDNVDHAYQYNPATRAFDVDMGPAPSGTASHQIFQAGAIEQLAGPLQDDINAHRNILGKLSSYYKDWSSGTPVADPDAARILGELMSFASTQPALHSFRSTSAMEAYEKILGGLAKNPDATIATIQGLLKTPETFTNMAQRPKSGPYAPKTPATPAGSGESPQKMMLKGEQIEVRNGQWVYSKTGKEAK